MYDDDEEIKRKRRNLILIILIIIAIIILLIVFLINRKNFSVFNNGMSCELQIVSGEKDKNGKYLEPVVVGFSKVDPENKITKKVVGPSEKDAVGDTYTITKEGVTTVKGFVYNAKNQVSTCTIEVDVAKTTGKCSFEVTEGTKGQGDWYTSDVKVKLKATDTGDLNITKYNISVKDKKTDDNKDTYSVTANGATELVGTIEYSNGKSTTCTKSIKIDKNKPTCSLKVTSGEKSGNVYTSNVTVEIGSTKDEESGVLGSGFGNKENFSETKYVIKEDGTKEVVGYVKDKAGNLNTCKLSITKGKESSGSGSSGSGSSGSSSGNPSGSTIINKQEKICSLRATGVEKGGVYTEDVVISFKEVNEGVKTSYITVGDRFAGYDSVLVYGITSPQEFTANATVWYNDGKQATCSLKFTVDPTKDVVKYFLKHARVGDKTDYSAGNWTTSSNISSKDGGLGGYRAGNSKDGTISCHAGESPSRTGWVVYKKDANKVELIHAGTPICMTHTEVGYQNALNVINQPANAYAFVNSYAQSAYYLTWEGYGYLSVYGNQLIHNGQYYYLAGNPNNKEYNTDYLNAYFPTKLWAYDPNKRVHSFESGTLGLRPIVVLKSNVGAIYSNGYWYLRTDTKEAEDEYTVNNEIFDNIIESIIDDSGLY
jgi:hypothetical protein